MNDGNHEYLRHADRLTPIDYSTDVHVVSSEIDHDSNDSAPTTSSEPTRKKPRSKIMRTLDPLRFSFVLILAFSLACSLFSALQPVYGRVSRLDPSPRIGVVVDDEAGVLSTDTVDWPDDRGSMMVKGDRQYQVIVVTLDHAPGWNAECRRSTSTVPGRHRRIRLPDKHATPKMDADPYANNVCTYWAPGTKTMVDKYANGVVIVLFKDTGDLGIRYGSPKLNWLEDSEKKQIHDIGYAAIRDGGPDKGIADVASAVMDVIRDGDGQR